MAKYGLIKKCICVSLTECDDFTEATRRANVHGCDAVEIPDGYGVGSTYETGVWGNPLPEPEPEEAEPTTEELLRILAGVSE